MYLDPPVAVVGEVSALHLEYTVPEGVTVNDGTSLFIITINGLPFSPTTEDLCAQIPCPITSGDYVNSTQSIWPDISGKLVTSVSWFDENNTELLCFEVTAKI